MVLQSPCLSIAQYYFPSLISLQISIRPINPLCYMDSSKFVKYRTHVKNLTDASICTTILTHYTVISSLFLLQFYPYIKLLLRTQTKMWNPRLCLEGFSNPDSTPILEYHVWIEFWNQFSTINTKLCRKLFIKCDFQKKNKLNLA